MRRNELCDVTGMTAHQFNFWRQKGQMPFELFRVDARDGASRSWSNYSIHEAAAMLAAKGLVEQGLSWQSSCDVVRHGKAQGGDFLEDYSTSGTLYTRAGSEREAPGGDWFLVRAKFAPLTSGAPNIKRPFHLFMGPMADVSAAIGRHVDAFNERVTSWDRIVVAATVGANVTHSLHLAEARMRQLGIDFDSDGDLDEDLSDA